MKYFKKFFFINWTYYKLIIKLSLYFKTNLNLHIIFKILIFQNININIIFF